MPHIKKQKLPHCIYFVTNNTFKRKPILKNETLCDILMNDFKFYRKKYKFLLLGYVILYDHFHALIMTGGKGTISDIMHDIKSHSSHIINEVLKKRGSNWQTDFYPEIIDEEKFFFQKLDYIHNNPIKHGCVNYSDEWKYSSYKNYYMDDDSTIDIDRLD